MRISLQWLKDLIEIDQTPEELGQMLTVAGFEVEEIEDRSTWADGVVIGRVLQVEPHPNADKLNVCQVDIGGEEPSQIVCGASNVRSDIFVAVATLNTFLPAVDLKIKKAKLRGVESKGMICSLSELGLEKQSPGIHIFDNPDLTPGQDVRPLLGLDDVILDLSTTANRADALSMVGVAREVAALTGKKLNLPPSTPIAIESVEQNLGVEIADTDACLAYIGTAIANVTIAPSPQWLQSRLQAAGTRPINNVVDITNYVLLEWGQPLHAFDRERLAAVGGDSNVTIGVRFARDGEELVTLDGQTRQLVPQNLLITANDHPVALGGVMGGENTEVHDQTQNIVLEAALFDSVVIRRSSRSQNLRSEASTRYERGVNLAEFRVACNRAIALIQEIAGGQVVEQRVNDHRPDPHGRPPLKLRLDRVHQLLGQVEVDGVVRAIDQEEVEKILTALGCVLNPIEANPLVWLVEVPPYRHRDLEREIDLIEEIARLYGYDYFCSTLPKAGAPGHLSIEEASRRKIRDILRGLGLTELMQYSLVKPTDKEIVLSNPLFAEYSALRTDLITGLIEAFAYNHKRNDDALNGFEIGRIFWQENGALHEGDAIGGIMGGDFRPGGLWTRSGKPQPMDWYEAKGLVESFLEGLGLKAEFQPDRQDERLHPGRTASLWLNGKRLGAFGQVHPSLRQAQDLPDEVYVFEMHFPILLAAMNKEELITPHFQSYSTYPAVTRDLAFYAPLDLSVGELTKTIRNAGGKLLAEIQLFDQYQGEHVPTGQRSLAFSLAYRASDRTLTDEDIEPNHQQIRDSLTQKHQVTLRS